MAMPVPVIPLPAAPGGDVHLLNPPGSPVSLADVGNAPLYTHRVVASRDQHRVAGGPTESSVGDAVLYEKHVAEAHNPAGGVPAWAQNLINVIHDMRVDQLKLINSGLGEGRGTQFEVVPFRGLQGTLDDPTVAPHNLPPLHHIDAIKALNGNQLTAYCLGYGIPVPNQLRRRKEAVARRIGYRGDERF
ncbi:hypothetical protein B0H14DRAFT_3440646 [Mycena olivaceomarginata]|nr:hypothetical protein B0H14DRAFT_3440646 [Mycena olivaceomarginata]